MKKNSVHFYVTPRDSFSRRHMENDESTLFDDLESPFTEAGRHLTPGHVYPVLGISEDVRQLKTIDDKGNIYTGLIGLFKFVRDESGTPRHTW